MKRFFGVFKKCVILIAVLGMLVNNIGFVRAEGEISLDDTSKITIADIPIQAYTGNKIEPELTIKDIEKNITLKAGVHYNIDYYNNTDIGDNKASAIITGRVNNGYTGSRTIYFSIAVMTSLGDDTVGNIADVELYSDKNNTTKTNYNYTYTGSDIKPYPIVKLHGKTLKEDEDYTVSYDENRNTSSSDHMAKVIINGTGNYSGKCVVTFGIYPKDDTVKTDARFNNTLTYNGKDQEFIVSPYVLEGATSFRYGWYSSAESTTTPQTPILDYKKVVGKNVGDYRLYIESSPSEGYRKWSSTETFTIQKKTPQIGLPTLAKDLTYNNDSKKLITAEATPDLIDSAEIDDNGQTCTIYYAVTIVDSAPDKDAINTWETSIDNITGKDAGTYYIWYKVTGTDNFYDVDPKKVGTVTIAKANPSIDKDNTYPAQEKDYTSSPINIDSLDSYITLVGGEAYNKQKHNELIYEYQKWTSGEGASAVYSSLSEAPTDASKDANGEHPYKVKVTLPASNNYNTATKEIYLTIKTADLDVTDPELLDSVYDGKEQDLVTEAVKSVIKNTTAPKGTVSYAVTDIDVTSLDNTVSWSTSVKEKNAGEYKVWYKVDSDKPYNYNSFGPKSAGIATIAKANPIITISSKTESYTGQPISIDTASVTLVNGEPYSGTIKYEYKESTAAESTYSETVPTNAGTYTVRASIAEQNNYNKASQTTTLTINKINQTPTAPRLIDDTSLTYTGGDIKMISSAAIVVDNCTAEYAVTTENAAPAANAENTWYTDINNIKGKDAGTYYVWYKSTGDTNHNDFDVTYVDSVTIGTAEQTVTAPHLNSSVEYDPKYATDPYNLIETEAKAVISGTSTSCGTIKYLITAADASTPDGTESGWSTTATASKAGTYKVWYMSVSDNTSNYNSSTPTAVNGTVTIRKIDPSVSPIPTLVSDKIDYDGTDKQLIAAAGTVTDSCKILYAVSESTTAPTDSSAWKENITDITGKDYGTYYVFYKVEENDNYKAIAPTQIGSKLINKVDPIVKDLNGISNLEYTGSPIQLITQGSVEGGTLYYGIGEESKTPEDTAWTTKYSDITETAIGTYYVYYKVVGDKNHNDIVATKMDAIKIDEATITLKVTQELDGDLIITTEPFNVEYLNTLGSSGSVKLIFPSGGTDTVTITSDKIETLKESGAIKALRIPYSEFQEKNKAIDKFSSTNPLTPNTFGVKPLKLNNFKETSAIANTTRGIEHINLYTQIEEGQLTEDDKNLKNDAKFYFNGIELKYDEAKDIIIEDNETKIIQTFKYKLDNEPIDSFANGPTGFTVYEIGQKVIKANNIETSQATLRHLEGLDNCMMYVGVSIRVDPNKPNGIRIKTAIPKTTRDNLINNNVEGYKLVEYGTMMAWEESCEMPYMKVYSNGQYEHCSNSGNGLAYNRAKQQDDIFDFDENSIRFTNVLTDTKNTWDSEKLKKSVVFRPYMILQLADGDETTNVAIYGGAVYRSIYHVAVSNKDKTLYNTYPSVKAYIDSLIETADQEPQPE